MALLNPSSWQDISLGLDKKRLIRYNSISYEDGCNGFFGRINEIRLMYSTLGNTRWTPSPPIFSSSVDDAIFHTKTVISSQYGQYPTFTDILSPVFTPGSVKTVARETGGYQEYAGQEPSELSFSTLYLDGLRTAYHRFMGGIKPMSIGAYLTNASGDTMGILVEGTNLDNQANITAKNYMFLPIPILSICKVPGALGNAEEPDSEGWVITFPPHWESPYGLGQCLEQYSASLKSRNARFGRVTSSHAMIVPRMLI